MSLSHLIIDFSFYGSFTGLVSVVEFEDNKQKPNRFINLFSAFEDFDNGNDSASILEDARLFNLEPLTTTENALDLEMSWINDFVEKHGNGSNVFNFEIHHVDVEKHIKNKYKEDSNIQNLDEYDFIEIKYLKEYIEDWFTLEEYKIEMNRLHYQKNKNNPFAQILLNQINNK